MTNETPWRRFTARHDPTGARVIEARREVPEYVEWRELQGAGGGHMDAPEFRAYWVRERLSEIGLADVHSSNISAVGYDAATWQLLIQFVSKVFEREGAVYLYDNVPPDVAAPLVRAIGKQEPEISLGGYFTGAIRAHPNRYPYVKLLTTQPSEPAPTVQGAFDTGAA